MTLHWLSPLWIPEVIKFLRTFDFNAFIFCAPGLCAHVVFVHTKMKENIGHFTSNSTNIFHICSIGCIIEYYRLLMTHEMVNGKRAVSQNVEKSICMQISSLKSSNQEL